MAAKYGNVEDVKLLTGITPGDLGLSTEAEVDAALDHWISGVDSLIDTLLGASAPADNSDPKWDGLVGVSERTVANIVAYARGVRETVYSSVDEFKVDIFNASDATKRVKRELSAFLSRPVSAKVFTSMTDDELADSIYGDTPGGTMSTA